jgi:hypothetical protein
MSSKVGAVALISAALGSGSASAKTRAPQAFSGKVCGLVKKALTAADITAPGLQLPARTATTRRAWRNVVCVAGPRWTPSCGVLSRPKS